MNTNTRFISDPISAERTITLKKDISALELVEKENATRMGVLSLIPKGSQLDICGLGFNERTYTVQCNNRTFVVFQQDVNPVWG